MKGWYQVFSLLVAALLIEGCTPRGSEPTEEELQSAVLYRLEPVDSDMGAYHQYGGLHLAVKGVRKIGCEEASEKHGYICTYQSLIDYGAASHQSELAGRERKNVMPAAFLVDRSGYRTSGVSAYHRDHFVRGWNGWELASD